MLAVPNSPNFLDGYLQVLRPAFPLHCREQHWESAVHTAALAWHTAVQPVVLKAHEAVQASVPPPNPRLWHVWPPRSLPSQLSPDSLMPLPQADVPPPETVQVPTSEAICG